LVLLRKGIVAEHYSIGVGRTFKNFPAAKETKRFYTTAIKDNNVNEPKLSPN
jgi:hypothetical protein